MDAEKEARKSPVCESLEADRVSSTAPRDVESTAAPSTVSEQDRNLVTWDSPDSQENPRNWTPWRKRTVIATVSCYAFLSPLSSSMVAPALPLISSDFNITNSAVENMVLSAFVLGYALSPFFYAGLSEMYGRIIILQSSNALFLAFTLAAGFSQNAGQMIGLRLAAGIGGAAPLTLGSAMIADLYPPDVRGVAVSLYTLLTLLGPAIGPIVGGW